MENLYGDTQKICFSLGNNNNNDNNKKKSSFSAYLIVPGIVVNT